MFHQRRLPGSWFALDPEYSIVAFKIVSVLPLLELRCCKQPVTCVLVSRGYIVPARINIWKAERLQASCFGVFWIGHLYGVVQANAL